MLCPTLEEFRRIRPPGALPWLLGESARNPGTPLALDLADVVHVGIRWRTPAFLEQLLRGLAASLVAFRSPYKAQVACVADERIAWKRFLDSAFIVPEGRDLEPDAVAAWIEDVATVDGRLRLNGATLHPSVHRNRPFDGRPFVDQGPDFAEEVVCVIPDIARLDRRGEVIRLGEARSRGVHLVIGIPTGSDTQSMRESQELLPAEIGEEADGSLTLRAWQRQERGTPLAVSAEALGGLLTTAGW